MKDQTESASSNDSVPRFTPRDRVALLTTAAIVTAAGLLGLLDPLSNLGLEHPLAMLMLMAAFALSERLLFTVEVKSQAVTHTPSEVLLAIGLLALNPYELVAARVLGGGLGVYMTRRPPFHKLAFNLSHVAVETSVAVLLFASLRSTAGTGVLGSWISIVLSLMIASVLGGMFVTAAIAQYEGDLFGRLRHELTTGFVLYLPVIGIGASIAIPLSTNPRIGLVAAVPAPIIWLLLRAYGSLRYRHSDLIGVHDFSRHLGESSSLESMASTATSHITSALRAGEATMRIWSEADERIDVGDNEATLSALPLTVDDPVWQGVLRSTGVLRFPDLPVELRASLARSDLERSLIAPITDSGEPLGILVLTDRLGASKVFDESDVDRLTGMVQQLSLATRKERLRTQMQFDATHDRLTLLANRGRFEQFVDNAGRSGGHGAVFLIDLDRFKQINDAFGHHAGDTLLIEAGRRVRHACVIDDAVSRFGGDEFAVFLPNVSADEAATIAASISEWLERPFDIESAKVAVGASIGIAMMPEHGDRASRLIRRADIAMYDAKARRIQSSMYRDSLDKNDSNRSVLLNDLRTALRDNQISVHFQPQVDISTRRLTGAEALARWDHPTKGRIQPDHFIELAEQAGLIEELTGQVLLLACQANARWRALGFDINVAVNISPQSLLDERLGPMVEETLRSTTIDPQRLMLEITESTMMADDERSHRVLHQLSGLGVQVSVDDFGTGFSSLVNLRRLPVNELKIDRSFISSMQHQPDDEAIVRSTVQLGHNLGLNIVAEGVETEEVMDLLSSFGCDTAQGFGISRPLPAEAFEVWLIDYGRQPIPWETAGSEVTLFGFEDHRR